MKLRDVDCYDVFLFLFLTPRVGSRGTLLLEACHLTQGRSHSLCHHCPQLLLRFPRSDPLSLRLGEGEQPAGALLCTVTLTMCSWALSLGKVFQLWEGGMSCVLSACVFPQWCSFEVGMWLCGLGSDPLGRKEESSSRVQYIVSSYRRPCSHHSSSARASLLFA